jgi:hypothetical protein
MSDLNLPPAHSQLYDVYFTVAGGLRLVWRFADHGITVGDDGIAYMANDSAQAPTFADIAAIRLSTAGLGDASNVIDQCKIEFNSGSAITVSNATSTGLPDAAQTRLYRAFVQDLHSRLVASGHDGIRFVAGMSSGRYKGAMATMLVSGLLLILTPLVVAIVTGDPHALIPMVMGACLIWPFLHLISNNAPRNYAPDSLPDELIS